MWSVLPRHIRDRGLGRLPGRCGIDIRRTAVVGYAVKCYYVVWISRVVVMSVDNDPRRNRGDIDTSIQDQGSHT